MQQRLGLFRRLFQVSLLYMHRRFNNVLHHRLMRPEVKALKHKAELHAHQLDTLALRAIKFFVGIIQRYAVLAHGDNARLRHFQKRNTAQQRAFARSAGADQRDNIAILRRQADVVQHFMSRIALSEMAQHDGWLAH